MAASFPDGTRWRVVYTKSSSKKKKIDGFLTLRYMPGGVARRILLYDADGTKSLGDRLLRKFETFPVYEELQIDDYAFEVVELVEDGPPRPSSIPLLPRASIPAALPRPLDPASDARVGTEWDVFFTVNSKKKTVLEGVVRLVQVNDQEKKVILLDNLGKNIGEHFFRSDKEITSGKTLEIGNCQVEVNGIKKHSSIRPEIVDINESPTVPKSRPLQPRKSFLQGKANNRGEDRVEREELTKDSGIRSDSALKAKEKQKIQPRRQRTPVQVVEDCTRPVNAYCRESSSTANPSSRELAGTEGTSMLSSTSGRRHEEESSAARDCAHRLQKLDVGRACPESSDDDCVYIEYGLIQQENRLGKNRRGSVINLDQFDVVVKQPDTSPENDKGEASLPTRIEYSKCSEEVKIILDERRFRLRDFWEGYKLYCFGYYSHCRGSKEQFLQSEMGRIVCLLHTEKDVRWGSKFDETVRQVWAMMEEYFEVRRGKVCTNLRSLVDEFEDVKELAKSENGSLLLQLIKDEEHETEPHYTHSRSVELQTTNVFDQFRTRLKEVDSNLDSLVKSSGSSSANSSGIFNALDNRNTGSRNSYEISSVGNAAKFSGGSRNKSKVWSNNALPSFDLGI